MLGRSVARGIGRAAAVGSVWLAGTAMGQPAVPAPTSAATALPAPTSAATTVPVPTSTAPGEPSVDDARRAVAARMAEEARLAFEAGRYADAVDQLEGAERLEHAPLHLIYLARLLNKLGRLMEAREAYRRVAAEPFAPDAPAALQEARTSALQEYAAIERRIPRLTILLVGAPLDQVRLTIDGKVVPLEALAYPLRVDPGTHEIVAEKGFSAVRQRVAFAEGPEIHPVRLVLPHRSAPSEAAAEQQGLSGWAIASLVGLGLGGVSLSASLPLGILSVEHDQFQGAAAGTALVGGLLVIGCASWFWGLAAASGPAPTGPAPADSLLGLAPTVGPGSMGLSGRF
jgi:hypothetical protein